MTEQSLQMVERFAASRVLEQPPRSGGLDRWPALLVDAWVVLARELALWRSHE